VRPTFNPAAATLGPSFPSGHSATAAALYAAVALVLARRRAPRYTCHQFRRRGTRIQRTPTIVVLLLGQDFLTRTIMSHVRRCARA
jgi:membrane-associated phospholipid phosphatase